MNIQSGLGAAQPVTPEVTVNRTGSNAQGAAAEAGAAAVADGDTTHISHAGASAAAASGLSEVRTEKVAAIQQSLANGSYAVSASDVAGKLIDQLLQH
jgi:negative regulator of flagellin synthesis FlgM